MGNKARREYLARIRYRYKKASRKAKKLILDEFCAVCGYHRKHAIRLLRGKASPPRKKKGPASIYDNPEFIQALRTIWNAAGNICSRRLKAAIPIFLPWYKKHYMLSPETERLLLDVSPKTMDRKLKSLRVDFLKKRFSSTKPGSLLKNQIPIKTGNWDVTRPGFMEADTVAHCGSSLAGDLIYTLVMTDIHTGWTEQRAVWNKGQAGVFAAVRDIEEGLPFPLLGFDCDNGSEFLNHHLWRYCTGKNIAFTRSRPYKKDDNAHVEQKNWTHVRQLLGYIRLEKPELVDVLNDLYVNQWNLYVNFFLPSMKLEHKERVGSRMKRIYDDPMTPFQRVMDCADVSGTVKNMLKRKYEKLDPFELRAEIDGKVALIQDIASVTSNTTQRILIR